MQPAQHVPHVADAEVLGDDGGKLWLMRHGSDSACDLWALQADHGTMARVRLGRGQMLAAAELLLSMAGALPVPQPDSSGEASDGQTPSL